MPSFCQLIWHYQYGLLFALLTHLPWCAIIAAHKVDSLKNIVYCFNITGHKNHIQRKWILNNRCHIQVQIPVKYLQATITFLAVTECGMKQTFIIKFWLFNDLDVVLVRFFCSILPEERIPHVSFRAAVSITSWIQFILEVHWLQVCLWEILLIYVSRSRSNCFFTLIESMTYTLQSNKLLPTLQVHFKSVLYAISLTPSRSIP